MFFISSPTSRSKCVRDVDNYILGCCKQSVSININKIRFTKDAQKKKQFGFIIL